MPCGRHLGCLSIPRLSSFLTHSNCFKVIMCPTQCWKRGTVVECLPTTCDALSSIPSTGHTQKSTVTSSPRSKVVMQPLWQLRWSPYDLNGFHRELFKGKSWLSVGVDTKFPFSCLPQEQTSHLHETRMTAAPGLSNLRLSYKRKPELTVA